eukprot:SAG31_NODE_12593_length_931_cov_0.805288_1_plen_261_part_00
MAWLDSPTAAATLAAAAAPPSSWRCATCGSVNGDIVRTTPCELSFLNFAISCELSFLNFAISQSTTPCELSFRAAERKGCAALTCVDADWVAQGAVACAFCTVPRPLAASASAPAPPAPTPGGLRKQLANILQAIREQATGSDAAAAGAKLLGIAADVRAVLAAYNQQCRLATTADEKKAWPRRNLLRIAAADYGNTGLLPPPSPCEYVWPGIAANHTLDTETAKALGPIPTEEAWLGHGWFYCKQYLSNVPAQFARCDS